jgi:hypothetical protein
MYFEKMQTQNGATYGQNDESYWVIVKREIEPLLFYVYKKARDEYW